MSDHITDNLQKEAIELLRQLIATPSFSKEEEKTAQILDDFFRHRGIIRYRYLNNVWGHNAHFDASKPTILLNSHHDTVKPDPKYTKNPFAPLVENEKLFGLGSNDAGGS